jgi:hypothetical protein
MEMVAALALFPAVFLLSLFSMAAPPSQDGVKEWMALLL